MQPGLTAARQPATAVLQRQLRSAWKQFQRQLPATVQGSREALHEARLALREVRTLLNILPSSRHAPNADAMLDRLTPLNDLLGSIRDRDIIEALLARHKIKAALRPKSRRTVLENRLGKEKEKTLRALRRFLASKDWAGLCRVMKEFLALPSGPRRPVYAGFARRSVAKTRDRMQRLAPLADAKKPAKLHRLRIAIRKHRILLTLFAPVLEREARQEAKLLRRCERRLGKVHDVDLAGQWLAEQKQDRDLEPLLAQRRRKLLRKFKHDWREARTTTC